jgi:hypothetical protein
MFTGLLGLHRMSDQDQCAQVVFISERGAAKRGVLSMEMCLIGILLPCASFVVSIYKF